MEEKFCPNCERTYRMRYMTVGMSVEEFCPGCEKTKLQLQLEALGVQIKNDKGELRSLEDITKDLQEAMASDLEDED